MRIQIVDLPNQIRGDVVQSPYLLVISELRGPVAQPLLDGFRKDGFENCAGVIATDEVVHIGEESLYELQSRESMSLRTAEMNLGLPYGSIVVTTPWGRTDIVGDVECPEQAEGRGCACALGGQDCPINGNVPASIGVMDIAHEERAVSVTENEGGTRVAHIAIDVDQTPEELASDVAAIVEEQRGEREYRQIGYCSCRVTGEYEATCGIPQHREGAAAAAAL